METRGRSTETLRDLWFAYLVRTLESELSVEERSGLGQLLKPQGADIGTIATAFGQLGTRPVVALDCLDARLNSEGRYVFVT